MRLSFEWCQKYIIIAFYKYFTYQSKDNLFICSTQTPRTRYDKEQSIKTTINLNNMQWIYRYNLSPDTQSYGKCLFDCRTLSERLCQSYQIRIHYLKCDMFYYNQFNDHCIIIAGQNKNFFNLDWQGVSPHSIFSLFRLSLIALFCPGTLARIFYKHT